MAAAKYSISIMAHPCRRRLIPNLLLSLQPVSTRIAWDKKNNIWDTCKRAWMLHDPAADYHLVLQDDAVICKDFHSRLSHILNTSSRLKNFVVSLYIGNRNRFKAEVDKFKPAGGILIKENIHHEIALIFPVHLINEMISYVDALNPETDKAINEYVRKKNLKVLIPLPTLIDHLNIPSLHNLNTSLIQNRTSIWFAGR